MTDLNNWHPGQRIENFTVQRYLGQGWEGAVLLVRDRRVGQLRTLKLFKGCEAEDTVAHLVRHWRRYAAISQVKKYLECGLLTGQRRVSIRPWMAFEYIRGMTLAETIERGHIRDPTAMALKLLKALVPIHARGASIGDMDNGRNLVVERGTRRYVFVDVDAGAPDEPPPAKWEDLFEVQAMTRRLLRVQGQRTMPIALKKLDNFENATQALTWLAAQKP